MTIDVNIVGPEGFPREDLLVWFDQRNIAYDVRPWHRGKCVTLNRSIVEFLAGSAEFLWQIEDDVRPGAAMEKFLAEPGQLIYCGIPGRRGAMGHHGDGDFGASCFRASRELLLGMQAAQPTNPWFARDTTPLGDRTRGCLCTFFRRRAQAVGAQPRCVGEVDGRAQIGP